MPDEVILDVTTIEENVTVETTAGDVVEIQIVAPIGPAGPNSVTSATTSDGTADLDVDTITGDGSGLTGLVSSQITDASMGATDESVVNVLAKFGPYGELSATQFQAAAISVIPNGIINLASTNVGGVVTLNGELATDARSIAFPNASGTVALTSDITNAVTSETTSDGTASLNISNLTLSQAITSGIQTKMTFTAQPTTVGDGQQIIWQWYNGGSPLTTAVIATEVTSSNSDKLIFKTSELGSLATSLDLNNSLATFSGVVSSLGATYQTGSTFTYNGASAAAHRTALGVSASGDTVLKSAYTPAHSLLVQQSGTGSPSSLSVGNNTILGRASGGGSAIAALSGSDARTVLGLSTLATTTPAVNVATFLETPTSANLAAAVTGETGSGALVFGTSPSITTPTIRGAGASTGTMASMIDGSGNVRMTIYDNGFTGFGGLPTTGQRVTIYQGDSNGSQLQIANTRSGGHSWIFGAGDTGSTPSVVPAGGFFFYDINGTGGAATRLVIDGSGNVGIGTTAPNAKAILDLTSTTKGFLPPRMTTTQRNAITSVPAGLMVYNTTLNKLNVYNGTAWEVITSL
jgi:hypothetical protein